MAGNPQPITKAILPFLILGFSESNYKTLGEAPYLPKESLLHIHIKLNKVSQTNHPVNLI